MTLKSKFSPTGFIESIFPQSASEDLKGSISLPSNLFASIEGTAQVGIFFTLYSTASLFPLRPADSAEPAGLQRLPAGFFLGADAEL